MRIWRIIFGRQAEDHEASRKITAAERQLQEQERRLDRLRRERDLYGPRRRPTT